MLSFSLEDLDLVSVPCRGAAGLEQLSSLSLELRASQHCKLEMSEHSGGQGSQTRVSLEGNHLHSACENLHLPSELSRCILVTQVW